SPLRCAKTYSRHTKRNRFLVKWKSDPPSTKGTISLYIPYTMDQLYLPMDLEDDIPPYHLVRIVNESVNRSGNKISAS
ncbi:hypothetical protein ABES58_34175, partial [Paenibacillus lautus]|uniref:hypothetical protein n=1 Tax=Paenibacillus lautus TaxID=1401 RepID=UPI003D26B487